MLDRACLCFIFLWMRSISFTSAVSALLCWDTHNETVYFFGTTKIQEKNTRKNLMMTISVFSRNYSTPSKFKVHFKRLKTEFRGNSFTPFWFVGAEPNLYVVLEVLKIVELKSDVLGDALIAQNTLALNRITLLKRKFWSFSWMRCFRDIKKYMNSFLLYFISTFMSVSWVHDTPNGSHYPPLWSCRS